MQIIEKIEAMLTDFLGPMGPLLALGGVGLMLIIFALPTMLKKQKDPLEGIRALRTGKTSVVEKLRRGGPSKADKLERFATYLEPQSAEELSATKMKLLRAGYRGKGAVRVFHFSQFALGIGVLILGLLYALLKSTQTEMTTQTMVMYTILPAAIGYYAPVYWVTRRVAMRQQEITDGFPDALDMMLVCVEAGQSLDQSIIRVGNEARNGYPALAEEFETVAQEVKAGKERITVLRDLSERVGLPDITSFVTTLIQSASFGTSIADALRVYSAEMRDKRIMRAEEKANTIPTKLTLGTMLFTLPPLLVILIGPSLAKFGSQMGGGG
ncbi:MAG: type II secretion system F family protein [Pseudotabrizicola sp.]|uniref:type II secretion system F family protein n=1 Tax=Pseudotabrizicola sp. TaxID=2939647 RepID=UPI0027314273|nr:type II secretion system F family protein [Pseudotabrizicola sp.]MDP2081659.1 type II secretion system F family protein [Pseudotabrizicola sp.]MDZ7574009.1 type II secretion system F family protein [Pseudotabrizicola sp.]